MKRKDVKPAVDRLHTPCPKCTRPDLVRLSDDLGCFYHCTHKDCPWETFIAWTDLDAHRARSSASVETNEGGALPLTLPTEARGRTGSVMSSRVLLVGPTKVGKTTLLGKWGPQQTLILDTHGGTRFLEGEHFVSEVRSFTDFTEAVDQIVEGKHQFKTFGIDTIDDIYKFADKFAGEKHNKIAAGLVEFGKGTTEAEALFRQQIGRLLASPYGIWFIGHTETEQIGNDTRLVPKLDKRVRTFIEGNTDFNWLARRIGKRAELQTQPTTVYAAGSRVSLPDPCPMDASTIYTAMTKGFAKPTQEPAQAADTAPAETEDKTEQKVAA